MKLKLLHSKIEFDKSIQLYAGSCERLSFITYQFIYRQKRYFVKVYVNQYLIVQL